MPRSSWPCLTSRQTLALYPPHGETLWGLLDSRTAVGAERPFLMFGDGCRSWGEVRDLSLGMAATLAGRGVGHGDRVAVMAANSDLFVAVFVALGRLGAILVPVNPEHSAAEAGYILGHAEVAAVLFTPATEAVARRAAGSHSWLARLGDLAEPTDLPPPAAAGRPDDTCLIMYTSGTTGFPKGVMHRQASFVMAGEGFVERMRLQPDDRLLCVLPLFHINALFYSVGGAMAAGASLVLAARFSASGFWALAARWGATQVNIIAAIGTILARRPRDEFVAGHRLVKVYGAPVTPEIAATFTTEFGIAHVVEGYGMTEIPGVCNQPFDGPGKPGSMGRAARHPDPSRRFAQLRVVDEAGREVADGETGELLVRTPIIMQGYWHDPEQTAAAFRDGWFATGDLVRRDSDGFYFFVARRKDIIRRRGENISGAELDRVVGGHPAIAEAAAIAVPSDLGEDEILVAVVARPGCSPTPWDIRDWCAAHLTPAKRPRFLVFATALPHTPTHRVAKFRLGQEPGLLSEAIDLDTLAAEDGPAAALPGGRPMTDLTPYRRLTPGTQPDYLHRPYASTVKRAPSRPLVVAPHTLSELTGPVFGHDHVAPGDADLTSGHAGAPLGERLIIAGRVLDENGRPVRNTLVEVWQANAAGRYRHKNDGHDAPLDPNFTGCGRMLTDDEGRYRFRTIRPGAYPWRNHPNAWRPAHIHFSLFGPCFLTRLVTQMYFPGDPLLPLDPIFNCTADPAARDRLISAFDIDLTVPEVTLGFRFDIVLRGRAATPMED